MKKTSYKCLDCPDGRNKSCYYGDNDFNYFLEYHDKKHKIIILDVKNEINNKEDKFNEIKNFFRKNDIEFEISKTKSIYFSLNDKSYKISDHQLINSEFNKKGAIYGFKKLKENINKYIDNSVKECEKKTEELKADPSNKDFFENKYFGCDGCYELKQLQTKLNNGELDDTK